MRCWIKVIDGAQVLLLDTPRKDIPAGFSDVLPEDYV